MKKIYLLSSSILLATCGIFFFQKTNFLKKNKAVQMPGAAFEEGRAERRAIDKMMFADPATGEIPVGIHFREQQFARELAANLGSERGGGGADWQPRGPFNVGGRTRAIAIDVTNPNRILAGGVSGGVWLSEDAGLSWSRRTPLNFHPGCVSIAQDPRPGFTNIWYYISGEITGTSASGGEAFYVGDGMFKSTDGGLTWAVVTPTAVGNPQIFNNIWQSGWRTAVHPTTGAVYAAVYNCIFRSTNGGTSWTASLGGQDNANSPFAAVTDLAISPTGIMYATFSSEGLRKGIWRSTNGGTNWTNITPANFPANYERIVLDISPNNENEVYFLAVTPGSGFKTVYIESENWSSLWKYKYVSGDGTGAGGEWADLSLNLPNTGTQFDRFAHQGGYDLMVKVQPGTGHVFVGGTNLWRSTSAFTTPDSSTKIGGYGIGTTLPFFKLYPNHHPDQHDVLFHPTQPNVMYSASDGGLHVTTNCLAPSVEWLSLNRGYQTSQFYTAIIERATKGDNTIIGGLQDNGNFFTNSPDASKTWVQTVNGDGAYGVIPDGKPYYILSIQQGRVVKCSIDPTGEVTGFQRFDPIGRVKGDYQFINPLAADPADQNILYLPAGNQFYRQSNLAAIPLNNEWDSISTGWTKFPDTLVAASGRFTAIGVSKNNSPHRVYLGTSRNRIYRIDNAHTGAANWTEIKSPLADATGTTAQPYVSCIAVDPDNADDVLLLFSNYNIYSLWRSTDGGATWKKIAGNLEQVLAGTGNGPSLRWVNILPKADGSRLYFCGTSVGLYSATELKEHATGQPGTVWTPEGAASIGSVPVPHIESRPTDGWVVAATHGHGMFSANFAVSSSPEPSKSVAQVRVFPNPSSDFAEFFVEGKNGERLNLRVFDSAGKLLKTENWQGERRKIDLAGLPNGVLIFEISGRGWREAGRFLKI